MEKSPITSQEVATKPYSD